MRCPFCSHNEIQVKDSRPSEDDAAIRRRRQCTNCGGRFTTMERIQIREITVIKNNNVKEILDREKLYRSIRIAVRKRNISDEKVEALSNAIVRRIESLGEAEIESKTIGEMVMETLAQLDMVAYIRFASVYKDFHEAQDFENIIAEANASKNNSKKKP